MDGVQPAAWESGKVQSLAFLLTGRRRRLLAGAVASGQSDDSFFSAEESPVTNLKSWAIKFWFLATALWVIGVYQAKHDALCAATYWHSPQEISKHLSLMQKELAKPRLSPSARTMLMQDHDDFASPHADLRCGFIGMTRKSAELHGGYEINWSGRLPSLVLLIAPPALLLLLGHMLRMVARTS